MTTRITQLDEQDGGRAVLRVEGSLGVAEVEMLRQACAELKAQTGRDVTLDLAGINFLDSESASVLTRLRREHNVALDGLHFFIRKVIEIAELAEQD